MKRWFVAILLATCMPGLAAAADLGNPVGMTEYDPLVPQISTPTGNPWASIYTGAGFGPGDEGNGSIFAYGTANFSLIGDLWHEGPLLRVNVFGGSYKYTGGGYVDTPVDNYGVDLLLGYRLDIGNASVTALAGPTFLSNNNPDPGAEVRGEKLGAKVAGEIFAPLTEKLDYFGFATFSTSYSEYFALSSLRFHAAPFIRIGPEVAWSGGLTYEQVRAGGRVSFDTNWGSLALTSGYVWKLDSDSGDGFYSGLSLGLNIR